MNGSSTARMPPGRPPKRPSESAEDLSLQDSPSSVTSTPKFKQARVERGPEDFSTVVKTKFQGHSRTGQACDRCKVRKIRCDALPEGCSHCTTVNLPCYVTDRVSRRTERRGYAQDLERQIEAMTAHIRDLEKLVTDRGVGVHPFTWETYRPTCPPGVTFNPRLGTATQEPDAKDRWSQVDSLWIKNYAPVTQYFPVGYSTGASSQYSSQPMLESRPTDQYLGVLPDSAPLSSIKGTKLSILGTTIDITSFDAPDMDEPDPDTPAGSPLYNKSLMAFLQSSLGINPKIDIELPGRDDAMSYVNWYFVLIHPFMPVLHRPSFEKLLDRIYDERFPRFQPDTCELVLVHMVFATIYFQYGIRAKEDPEKCMHLNDLSNKHYHWSLSNFFALASGNSVTAVQALTMIGIHTRNFPKPGCSAVVANYALSKAIELNLHRGVKIQGGGSNIENEVRKRVWWLTLGLAVTLNGRLGRPMPITMDEFDVEFPLAVPDECITDDGIIESDKECSFVVSINSLKLVPLYIQMYSTIYSVRRRTPEAYIGVVLGLEGAVQAVEHNLPDALRPDKVKNEGRMFALYMEAMILEFRLCLRHPSVCITDDREICADNTRICEQAAAQLLTVVTELLAVDCLDTTWYQLSVYVAAIFSSLAAHWERRFTATPAEITRLREDMKRWMMIVYRIGVTLGPGAKLGDEIGSVIHRTMNLIEHDMDAGRADQAGQAHQQAARFTDETGQHLAGVHDPVAPPRGQVPSSSAPGAHDSFRYNGEQRNDNAHDVSAAFSAHTQTAQGEMPTRSQDDNIGQQTEYYNSGVANQGVAPYGVPIAYAGQPAAESQRHNSNGMQSVGPYNGAAEGGPYLYAAATSAVPPSGIDQSAEATNPLFGLASQATAQVSAGQANGETDEWRQGPTTIAAAAAGAQGNTNGMHSTNLWQDWQTAVSGSSQTDQYSANALLTLGAGRPNDQNTAAGLDGGLSVGTAMGLSNSMTPTANNGQWPLLLYQNNNHGSVNGGA